MTLNYVFFSKLEGSRPPLGCTLKFGEDRSHGSKVRAIRVSVTYLQIGCCGGRTGKRLPATRKVRVRAPGQTFRFTEINFSHPHIVRWHGVDFKPCLWPTGAEKPSLQYEVYIEPV